MSQPIQIEDEPSNHGFTPLATEKKDREDARKQVLEQVPVLAEILDHFNEIISKLTSPLNFPDDLLVDSDKFMHTIAGRKHASAEIKSQRDYLQNRLDELLSDQ